MTIEQTVDISANRRLTIDVPPEIPSGRVVLAFTPASPEQAEAEQGFDRDAEYRRRKA
jgi:hypothetical protein